MLSVSEEGKRIFNSLSESDQKTLMQKVKDIIKDIVDWIDKFLSQYSSKSDEAKSLRNVKDAFDEVSKRWDKMLSEMAEHNKSHEQSGEFGRGTAEGKVLLQTRSINGNQVVWIEENILKENKGQPTHQFIADYIAEHIGDVYTIIESGQKVYIGKDLPNEYTQSQYTQNLFRRSPNIIKVKNKGVTNIKDIIEIATNRRWEKTKHTNNKDAKYGIYKYDTRFGFPVQDSKGNVVGANIYKAELVIRNASDGRKYLYDIVDINKDIASSDWMSKKISSAAGFSAVQKDNVSKDSIPNPNKNVNGKILRQYRNRNGDPTAELKIYSYNSNGGYDGKRMSNRAVKAYKNGEKPLSKWTKQSVIDEIENVADYEGIDIEGIDFSKLTLEELKSNFLKKSSWHHTGRFYNATDFYSVNHDALISVTEESINDIVSNRVRNTHSVEERQQMKTDKAALENAREKYRKLEIILDSGVTGLRTLGGLYKRYADGKMDLDSVYAEAIQAIKYKDAQRVESWKKLPEGHSRHETVRLYNEDFEGYLASEYSFGRTSNNSIIQKLKKLSLPTETVALNSEHIEPFKDINNSKKIQSNMSEDERYEILKDKTIENTPIVKGLPNDILQKSEEISSWEDINNLSGNNKRHLIHKIAQEFGVFKEYNNSDINISFGFSNRNFSESYGKQKRNYKTFAKMFSVFDKVIENAIGIEMHNRNNDGYKPDVTLNNVYVLISAFDDGNSIVPVKLEVKEFKDKQNTLYVAISLEAIKKTEVYKQGTTENSVAQNSRSVTISISDIFKNVNAKDGDFLKYIPNQFLNAEQIQTKNEALEKDKTKYSPNLLYQFRETSSVYDSMGEFERLQKDNAKLRADVERLSEALKLERKVTHGNVFNTNQIGVAAGHIRNLAKSNIDKVELMKSLKEFYSYIAESPELAWEDVFERAYRIAEDVLDDSKPEIIVDEYSSMILSEIRNTRISLSETQKEEARNRFGKNWNRNFFGRANITNEGIKLESQWQEWSEMYPDIFSRDIYIILNYCKTNKKTLKTTRLRDFLWWAQ